MSGNHVYDYIVVGCGGIGSAAVYWLSKRVGNKVLGLEQYELGHSHGGSQDHSRIIRLTYHDTMYTRLTPHTYEAFAEVERESGVQLVYKTGILDLAIKGTDGEQIVNGMANAMADQNIRYERFSPAQLRQRFPQFTPDADTVTVYQADGGLVDAALANSVQIQLSRAHGATILENTPVTRIDTNTDGTALVHTSGGTYSCKKVMVTAGAWVNHVLGTVGVHIPLRVTQEQITYFATPHVKKFTKDNFPAYIFHGTKEVELDFYGLPMHVNSGSKIGIDASGPPVTPETRNYHPDPLREQQAVDFLKKYIPESLGPKMYTKTCLYAMTPDRHFIIDTLALHGKPQIILCQGAGHAFKFSSLFGKILSELAIDGNTKYPVEGFTLNRPAITKTQGPVANPKFVAKI